MAIDDAIGVASFGSTATDDFPATTPPSLRTIATQADRDAAKAAIDGLSFGGSTMMGPGLQRAAAMLPTTTGRKAVVLLSDGFDNGTPDARTVAGGLPADVAIYSCAMGPLSDQTLLEDLAASTDGQYLYMPTIDDLFLIVNVIREQVTGDGLVVNEQHTASASRVGALIEADATEATFLINWADSSLAWSPRDPNEACRYERAAADAQRQGPAPVRTFCAPPRGPRLRGVPRRRPAARAVVGRGVDGADHAHAPTRLVCSSARRFASRRRSAPDARCGARRSMSPSTCGTAHEV